MKTPVEKFDQWILDSRGTSRELPKRFHPIPREISEPFDRQRFAFQYRLDKLRPTFFAEKSIPIYSDFFDSGDCNAAADIREGIGLIGITRGTLMLPLDLFFRMFSHPLVMPHVGNSSIEKFGPRHREGLFYDYDELIEVRENAGRDILPQHPIDRVRWIVAIVCHELLVHTLATHELVHIVHGHVLYQYKKLGVSCILEVLRAAPTTMPATSDQLLDLQAMEFWADAKAVEVILGGLISKQQFPALEEIFPSPADKVYFWAFTMYTLFRIWGLEFDLSSMNQSDHPPTVFRFRLAADTGFNEWKKRVPELSSDIYWMAVARGRNEAEKGIVYCGGNPLPGQEIMETVTNPLATAHYNQIADRHDSLAKELIPLGFLKWNNPENQD
jgi:hypothetical protein